MDIRFTVVVDPAIAMTLANALAQAFAPLFKSLHPAPGVTPADLNALETRVMAKLQDEIDALKKSSADMVARVTAKQDADSAAIAGLQSQVDALKAMDLTPEAAAALDEIKSGLDALDAAPPVVPPTP